METDLGAFEMLWDCEFCDTKKLLAKTQRFCPSCGGAQNPKSRYFPSDADKVAVKDHEFFGADVVCPACEVPNSRKAAHCVACGAALDKGKDAAVRQEQTRGTGESFAGETKKDAKKEHSEARLAREAASAGGAGPAKPAAPAKSRRWLYIVGGSVAALVVFVIVMFTWKKDAVITVVSHQWRRTISVERFAPKTDSSWCDSVPSDAYGISRKSEVRSQKKVADGKTCKTVRKDRGDGTFKESEKCETKYREEPVYDNKCYYSVNRWQMDRTLNANGTTEPPTWPDASSLRTGMCIGCERESSRKETYTLTLRTPEGSTSECDYDQAAWSAIADGTSRKSKVRMIGGGIDCTSFVTAAR